MHQPLRGIRGKLIAIFVLIKVVPLVLLAWFAWHATSQLGEKRFEKAGGMADAMLASIKSIGTVTDDRSAPRTQVRAEAIEALTTDTKSPIASTTTTTISARPHAGSIGNHSSVTSCANVSAAFHRHAARKLADDGKVLGAGNAGLRPSRVLAHPKRQRQRIFTPGRLNIWRGRAPAAVCRNDLYIDLSGNEKIRR